MTGRLHWQAGAPDPGERFLRARFHLDDGSSLTFGDMRRFGRAWLVDGDPREREAYWRARVGVEPLTPRFTARVLAQLLEGRRGPDQGGAAQPGAGRRASGNMYVDEALFAAAHPPAAPGGRPRRREEIRRLHRAIRDRLAAAVAAGGASIDSYRDGLGEKGSMQDLLRVHLHAGEPCPRCGTTIRKTRVAQRGTYWCPTCQPEPAPW